MGKWARLSDPMALPSASLGFATGFEVPLAALVPVPWHELVLYDYTPPILVRIFDTFPFSYSVLAGYHGPT